MNPEDREAYLKKKKEEAKLKLREIMKQKWVDAKKVRRLHRGLLTFHLKCLV